MIKRKQSMLPVVITKIRKSSPALFDRVAAILEDARAGVVRTVNSRMVIAYWLIGREIVLEEQGGERRAGYGETLLQDTAAKLTERYGKGFSVSSLKDFRQCYLVFSNRAPAIRHEPRGESRGVAGFSPDLSWTHYRLLMRVENAHARSFYEVEAIQSHWSTTDLEHQINSLLFERLLKSRDKKGVIALAAKGMQPRTPIDILKDPFVLEFMDLPESHRLVESRVEQSLIDHMQEFLLELGCGFAFVARQQRITLDGDHNYIDLVFYNIRLKCFVLIDLKVGKLTHGDLGQMQLYVNYYDRKVRGHDDNRTAGIIFCTDRNEAMVRYTLPQGQDRIFAARYRTALPSEEELLKLLRKDWECVLRENQAPYGDSRP